MTIYPIAGIYTGLHRNNIGTDKRSFALGKTRAEVINQLLS